MKIFMTMKLFLLSALSFTFCAEASLLRALRHGDLHRDALITLLCTKQIKGLLVRCNEIGAITAYGSLDKSFDHSIDILAINRCRYIVRKNMYHPEEAEITSCNPSEVAVNCALILGPYAYKIGQKDLNEFAANQWLDRENRAILNQIERLHAHSSSKSQTSDSVPHRIINSSELDSCYFIGAKVGLKYAKGEAPYNYSLFKKSLLARALVDARLRLASPLVNTLIMRYGGGHLHTEGIAESHLNSEHLKEIHDGNWCLWLSTKNTFVQRSKYSALLVLGEQSKLACSTQLKDHLGLTNRSWNEIHFPHDD